MVSTIGSVTAACNQGGTENPVGVSYNNVVTI